MVGTTSKLCAFVALSLSAIIASAGDVEKVNYAHTSTFTEGNLAVVEITYKTATIKELEFSPEPTGKNQPCKKRFGKGKPELGRLWGCDFGFICNPPDRCITEPSPDVSYVCPDQAYCVKAPKRIEEFNLVNGKRLIQLPYYPLDPEPFGASIADIYDTYVNLRRRSMYPRSIPKHLLQPSGVIRRQENNQTTTTSTTTAPPPGPTLELPLCYEFCRSAAEEWQSGEGSKELLCESSSTFRGNLEACETCIADNASPELDLDLPPELDIAKNTCEALEEPPEPPVSLTTTTEDPITTESSSTTVETSTTTVVPTTSETPTPTPTPTPSVPATTPPTTTSTPTPIESSSTTEVSSETPIVPSVDTPVDTPVESVPSTASVPTTSAPTTEEQPVITATITRIVNGTTTSYPEPTVTYEPVLGSAPGFMTRPRNALCAIVLTVFMFSVL